MLHTEPPPLAAHGLGVPPGLEQVLRSALDKDPYARFADILDFSRALETEAGIEEGQGFAQSESSRIGRGPTGAGLNATLVYGGTAPRPVPRSAERARPEPRQSALETPALVALTLDGVDEIPRTTSTRTRIVGGGRRGARGRIRSRAGLPLRAAAGCRRCGAGPSGRAPRAGTGPAGGDPFGGDDVQIEVVGAPAGVQVLVDGVLEDLPIRLPRGEAVHVLRFEAPGYEAREWKVNGRKDRTLNVHLGRRKERPWPARRPAPRGRPGVTRSPRVPMPRTPPGGARFQLPGRGPE